MTPHSVPMPTGWIVSNQFDHAADLLGLEPYMRSLLQAPFRSVTVEVPGRMDDGRYRGLPGLSHPAQRRARPVQGRHPVSPRGGRRGGAGPWPTPAA